MNLSWKKIKLGPLSVFPSKALCALFPWDSPLREMPFQVISLLWNPEGISTHWIRYIPEDIVRLGWMRRCLLFKRCEKGNWKGIQGNPEVCFLPAWWVWEKSAVDGNPKINAVRAVCISTSPRKSLGAPRRRHAPVQSSCSWSSTQNEVSRGQAERRIGCFAICLHSPSRHEPERHLFIHSFIYSRRRLCVNHSAMCAPLIRVPGIILNEHFQQNTETPVSPHWWQLRILTTMACGQSNWLFGWKKSATVFPDTWAI